MGYKYSVIFSPIQCRAQTIISEGNFQRSRPMDEILGASRIYTSVDMLQITTVGIEPPKWPIALNSKSTRFEDRQATTLAINSDPRLLIKQQVTLSLLCQVNCHLVDFMHNLHSKEKTMF